MGDEHLLFVHMYICQSLYLCLDNHSHTIIHCRSCKGALANIGRSISLAPIEAAISHKSCEEYYLTAAINLHSELILPILLQIQRYSMICSYFLFYCPCFFAHSCNCVVSLPLTADALALAL
jgi:hypothetical protein